MKYNKFTAIEIIQDSDIPKILPFFQSINICCNKRQGWYQEVFSKGDIWFLDNNGDLRYIDNQQKLLSQYTIIKGIPDDWQPDQEELQQSQGSLYVYGQNQSNPSINAESLKPVNKIQLTIEVPSSADFDFLKAIEKSNQNMEQKNKIIAELITLGDNLTTGAYSEETLNAIIPFINLAHRAKQLIK